MMYSVEFARGLMRVHVDNSDEHARDTITRDVLRRCAESAVSAFVDLSPEARSDAIDDLTSWAEMQYNVRQEEAAKLLGDDVNHVLWVAARRSDLFPDNGFWMHYRKLLDARLPPRALGRLDQDTDLILDQLEDPRRPGQWDRRGLVMGQVQSGKTNNYLGLITKAADAGYRLIVVLAGIHNSLRSQTQSRIDEAMVGRDTSSGPTSRRRIGVGRMAGHPGVYTMTSADNDGDFKSKVADSVGNPFMQSSICTVFVVKKHVSILANLHRWLSDNSNRPVGHERIANFPLLIIDDEADNASIDTTDHSGDDDTDPTKTNLGIRKLLHLFDQSAYVGYTATPFANVFIDDEAVHDEGGSDLFPRDFIFALDAPTNYTGSAQIFGTQQSAVDGDLAGLPLVSDIHDAEDWLPPSHTAGFKPAEALLPASLRRAVDSFVLGCAARRLRGSEKAHKSMLIHVSRYVDTQREVRRQVEDLLIDLRNEILYADADDEVWSRLREIWENDFVRAADALRNGHEQPQVHTFEEVKPHLAAAVAPITVKEVNGTSADVLEYHLHEETGHSVIVIGGDKLSRGLTLEGLLVSYYLRTTRMYDTLMQMGRWFGYRPGYLDLCRIYTAPEVVHWYQQIAVATDEMLEDFRAMQAAGARPKDFGLRVRHSPGMLITNPTKMRNGAKHRVNFGGQRPETTSFETSPDRRLRALGYLDDLVSEVAQSCPEHPSSNKSQIGWTDVPASTVSSYFERLGASNLYPYSVSARPRYLAEYINLRSGQRGLIRWTVLIRSNSYADEEHQIPMGGGMVQVGLSKRSDRGATGKYTIRSLIGSSDEAFDLTPEQLATAKASHVAAMGRAGKEPTDNEPTGRSLRQVRPTTNGLLILYVLDPEIPVNKERDPIPDGSPFAAYCVSLPTDPDNTMVEYMANTVFERDLLGIEP